MLRLPRFAALPLLAASALLSVACLPGPDVRSPGLNVRRVVIYRNGVGYFEREGRVDADEVTFKVRHERAGDFLATLVVIERGGSSVRSASFPVEVEKKVEPDGGDTDDDEAKSDRPDMPPRPPTPKKDVDAKDKLETVKLSLDGKEHQLVVGYVAETPVWRPSYRLVIGDKKVSAADSTADLQAWGIVQNLSGEDWKQVHLSLVAGAPLAFQSTLEKAVVPQRPIVSDQGEVIAAVPTGETSLATTEAPPPAPPPPPPPEAQAGVHGLGDLLKEDTSEEPETGGRAAPKPAKKPQFKSFAKNGPARTGKDGRTGGSAVAPSGMAAPMPAAPMPIEAPRMQNPSPPRNLSALAGVAIEAGTTRYDLPFAVDLPDNNATMVLLLSQQVPGEAIFLFSPDGGVPDSSFHPFRVARFVNSTKGLLERGPIAVFESGAFLGQGIIEPLPPGAAATVPFALERGIAVELARTDNQESSRLAHIESGEMEVERDSVTHSKYTVKNGSDDAVKILIKHARSPGTRLFQPPKGTEENTGTLSALVPLEVPKRATGVLDVDERRAYRQTVNPLEPLADDAVKSYLADPHADPAVAGPLRAAWELRGKLKVGWDEHDKLNLEKARLDSESEQLRLDLKAIEKDKTADALRKEHTERLSKASARVGEITKRLIELDTSLREQSIRFRDMLNAIKFVKAA